MGENELDRHKRSDDPDVEAHYHKSKGARDEGAKEPEDKQDETPDVEAHFHKSKG